MKRAFANDLRERSGARHLNQTQVARIMESSQSGIAKMEAVDPSVPIDLLITYPPQDWRPSKGRGEDRLKGVRRCELTLIRPLRCHMLLTAYAVERILASDGVCRAHG